MMAGLAKECPKCEGKLEFQYVRNPSFWPFNGCFMAVQCTCCGYRFSVPDKETYEKLKERHAT